MLNEISPVSILMPVNKIHEYLKDSLISVIKATRNVKSELLIVANNMDDHQLKSLSQIISEVSLDNFKLIDIGNSTLVEALNIGVNNCKYELIARFDSDDEMGEERLSLQIDFMDKNLDYGFVGSWSRLILNNKISNKIVKFPISHNEIVQFMQFGNCFSHPSVIFRKKLFIQSGGYSDDFPGAEDYDLWLRLIKISKAFNVPKPLINYRIHSGQISSQLSKVQIISYKSLFLRESIYRDEIYSESTPKGIKDLKHFQKSVSKSNLKFGQIPIGKLVLARTKNYKNTICKQSIGLVRYNLPFKLRKLHLYIYYGIKMVYCNPLLVYQYLNLRKNKINEIPEK